MGFRAIVVKPRNPYLHHCFHPISASNDHNNWYSHNMGTYVIFNKTHTCILLFHIPSLCTQLCTTINVPNESEEKPSSKGKYTGNMIAWSLLIWNMLKLMIVHIVPQPYALLVSIWATYHSSQQLICLIWILMIYYHITATNIWYPISYPHNTLQYTNTALETVPSSSMNYLLNIFFHKINDVYILHI